MKTPQQSTIEHRPNGWWATGLPADVEDCGPYDTKAEAEDDRRGIERYLRHGDTKGFITSDPT